MILGIGTDLANIERIEATIARFGTRFIDRVFTPREQAKAQSRAHGLANTYAKRWAAKEACSKALGTGLRMGIAWKDMAVSNLRSGQPVMHLTGWAAERLAQMTPPGHRAVVHVTLTDDHPWAQAFVVIEAVPLATPDLNLPNPSGLAPSGLSPTDPNPTGSNPTSPSPTGPNPTGSDPTGLGPVNPNPTELMPPRRPLP